MEPHALFLLLVLTSFCAELIDSSLGMGYGTLLTPLLLSLFGFDVLQIVPAILLTEIFTGLLGGYLHYRAGNLVLPPKGEGSANAGKVLAILTACSAAGALISMAFIINVPEFYVKLYIGVLIVLMGLFMLLTLGRQFTFSYGKIALLGTVASFNKSVSGGGFGPLMTGGQILSGVDSKSAIVITSVAEGVTCLLSFSTYLLFQREQLDPALFLPLCLGSVASVPLSVYIVKKLRIRHLTMIIALVTMALGGYTLMKLASGG